MGRTKKKISYTPEGEPKYEGLNPCWRCTSHGTAQPNGYVGYKPSGQEPSIPMHRYLYEELFGQLESSSIHIRHKCDNRWCINPEHLEPGTAADNVNDRMRRIGPMNSVITMTDACMILTLLKMGNLTDKEIASEYRTTRATIRNVKLGLTRKGAFSFV